MGDTREPGSSASWLDGVIRLALLAGLLAWAFVLVRPFVGMVVWGGVLATALHPAYLRAAKMLGGRDTLTATLFAVTPVVVLAVPTVILVHQLVVDAASLRDAYQAGELSFPAPPAQVQTWPVVGQRIHEIWLEAHRDLSVALQHHAAQLTKVRGAVWDVAQGSTVALVKLLFSLGVMAGMLRHAPRVAETVRALTERVAPARGARLVSLARDTTRSVARGIVGVAIIQGVLGGLGCLVVGIPGAGICALLILVLAVAQLPTLIVLAPAMIYVFKNDPTWVAVLFAVWSVGVGLLDNVLKPMLLGKGVDAPMLVVFLGAIGGMISSGVVGLFVGPVVLVVVHTLIRAWAFEPSVEEAR